MHTSVARSALIVAAFGTVALAPISCAKADTASEIAALKAQLKKLEAQVARQGHEARDAKAQAAHATNIANAAVVKGPPGPPPPPPVFVSFKNGLFVETEDKAYSFKVGGRILMDGGGIAQPLTGFSDQVGFRQVRMEVEGKAAKIYFYKLQYDFAGTGQNAGNNQTLGGIRDAFFGIQTPLFALPFAKDPAYVMVGSMFEPYSLEQINSSKYRDFIERSLAVDTFSPNRHVGLAAGAYGDNWTVKGGIFSTSFEDANLNPARGVPATWGVPHFFVPNAGAPVNATNWWQSTGGGQYYDLTGRLTYAPIKDEHDLLHLGVYGRYHQPNDATAASDDRVLALGNRVRSEANILGQGLIGTPDLSCGTISAPSNTNVFNTSSYAGKCVKNVESFGVELAASHGPFGIQAEYFGAQYNRDGSKLTQATTLAALTPATGVFSRTGGPFNPGGTSAYFDGYYVQGTYWITGEERAQSYEVKDKNGASFGQLKIKNPLSAGGWGAWGLAARYSSVNLNNGPFQGSYLYNLLSVPAIANSALARTYVANAGINGGRQEDVTVGLNWYPDVGFAVQANWVHVLNVAAPLNLNVNQSYYSGSHPNLFEVRAKVYW